MELSETQVEKLTSILLSEKIECYQPRKISFERLVEMNGWYIKVYSITYKQHFHSYETLDTAINLSEEWTKNASKSNLPIYNMGFLILHEAREGCWMLFNWWTGGEMIESNVFFSTYENAGLINESTHPGHLVCVWELQIIEHEKNAWIKHILSKSKLPRPDDYLSDTLNL